MDNMNPPLRESGFSLLELLLVVSIISLLTTIAVPSIAGTLRAAREARAIANCSAIGRAEIAYFASTGSFGIYGDLFSGKYLGENFVRNVAGTGASEVLSDGAYRYKLSFVLIAGGITIDADPDPAFSASHRWFRLRIGRTALSSSGGEGTLYFAPAMAYSPSPPTAAYRPLGS